jgi:adenylate cyclase
MAAVGHLILAAEVVGYSSLIEAADGGTSERLKTLRDEFFDPKVKEHNGRVVKTSEGSLLVEFASPGEAVRCAVELQRGMIECNIGAASDRRITFRVGIHINEPTAVGDDLVSRAVAALPVDTLATLIKPGTEIYGAGGNIAERIAALAEPGGICISGTVREAIRDQLPYAFEDIGNQGVDSRAPPVHCYVMRLDALTGRPRAAPDNPRTPPASVISSRPLRTPSQRVVLAAGLALTVAACIAGGWAFLDFLYHPASKPAPSATEKLAAEAKPPASARLALATIANLPKSPEAQKVPEPDSLPVPQEFNPPRASADETSPIADNKQQADPAARELITRGWALYHQPYNFVRWQEARADFQQALELDPRSSEARIGLGSILSAKLADGWSPVLQEDVLRAEQLLLEAIDDGTVPNRAAAHFTLGVLRQMQIQLPEAQKEFETAISLDPNNARTHFHLGETLMYLGQPEAAIPALERAIQLDPDAPNAALYYWAIGTCQLLLGRIDQAIDLLRTARNLNPQIWVPHFYLAGAYGLQGDLDQARTALAESMRLRPAIKSLGRMRAENPWLSNPQYWALQENTLNRGLRQAGLPD